MAKLAASEAATFVSHQVFSFSPLFFNQGLIIITATCTYMYVTTVIFHSPNGEKKFKLGMFMFSTL